MSTTEPTLTRKWIPMQGGSCDVRMAGGALLAASKVFAASVGKPKRCLAVVEDCVDDETLELLRRELVDAGFEVTWYRTDDQSCAHLEKTADLAAALTEAQITADDLCVAMGHERLITFASHVCDSWCGGVSLTAVPLDEAAFLEGALVPGALDVGDAERRVSARACAKHVLLDFDLAYSALGSEPARYARVLMVAAAMCSSERAFSALWDRAPQIMAADEGEFTAQLLDTAKARGQVGSSTAAAVRQSLAYGKDFAYALARASRDKLDWSLALGEGLRFAARLSVMLGKLSLDDMLAQDELLDSLEIPTLQPDVDADALMEALKRERFERSNRFMLLLPHVIGRVRLTTIGDELLLEHIGAWCDAHRR